ncbi:hypothetical protein PTQ27_05780 [Mannheimia sp. AT1]|uniref:DMT superfamily drug/metabolite transporter n=1 Tax=Mannheimia cairinae TaxID=3025936 RepID=A0ABT5MR74_9PAST|nr:hypothetical protein [Mannheimia cairinae]MDD0823974.1 hypothetical protein [Mannheimia cairinae]MDD0825290.1 hypothetical protein [Mannheimia cairinae]
MAHDHDTPSKLEISTHAALPMVLMLFIQMALNFYAAPANSIFISPYLLTIFITGLISFIVLWKGEICRGQSSRLTFILPFLLIFAIGNFIYSLGFTPKHNPMAVAGIAAIFFCLIYFRLPEDEALYNTLMYCGFAIVAIGMIQYLAIYWFELPSLFNGIRANNFAQILLGILLAGWYLMLARSRLEQFLKLLVKLAIIVLVLNYFWTAFVLYQHLQIMPEMSVMPFFIYFAGQFVILSMLAWLLLGKNIKNPTAWTVATFLAILYPFTNVI